jgi:predicted nucleic acid-binding protein
MSFLTDTDVLIDVANGDDGAIEYLNLLPDLWSISAVSAMEMIVGARNKLELEKLDDFLDSIVTHPLSPNIGKIAYDLLKRFSGSHGLRVFDSLIAAAAIQSHSTLVTRNAKHFRMIPELTREIPKY